MSGSNRGKGIALVVCGVIIAILLALLFAGYVSNQATSQQTEQHSTAQKTKKPEKIENVFSRKFPNWVIPVDTPAQWAMTFFAFLATGVSIWAVKLLKDTLRTTSDTLTIARKSNKIAADGILSAREMSAAQIRPWVDISVKLTGSPEASGGFSIEATLTNRGETPAVKCNASLDFRFRDPRDSEDESRRALHVDVYERPYFELFPDDPKVLEFEPQNSTKSVNSVAESEEKLTFFFRVDYSNLIGGKTARTEVCYDVWHKISDGGFDHGIRQIRRDMT